MKAADQAFHDEKKFYIFRFLSRMGLKEQIVKLFNGAHMFLFRWICEQ